MRRFLHGCVAAIVGVALLWNGAGCQGDLGNEFREVAGDDLQNGVLAVLTGIVNGTFAVYDPGTAEDPAATSSDNPS